MGAIHDGRCGISSVGGNGYRDIRLILDLGGLKLELISNSPGASIDFGYFRGSQFRKR